MPSRHGFFIVIVALVFLGSVRTVEAQCSFSVSPTTVAVPSFGMTSSLSVVTGQSCSWQATSPDSWITITSQTGQGLGQINYTISDNTTGAVRVGTITVAGLTTTFTQAVSSCAFTVTPTSVAVPSIGMTSAISVTTGSNCSWTATTTAPWITITSGGSSTGIHAVNYTVAANPTAAVRTGTMTVAGQTVTFTQAPSGCAATVVPSAIAVPLAGTSYTVSVTTGTSCAWTSTTTASWITITAGATGSGIGGVSFTVAPTSSSRVGTLTIAGQTLTVTQGDPPAAPTNLRIIR